jgi:DNA-binding CsgD family transcriptional regulator
MEDSTKSPFASARGWLTEREVRLIELARKPESTAQIARQMGVSPWELAVELRYLLFKLEADGDRVPARRRCGATADRWTPGRHASRPGDLDPPG